MMWGLLAREGYTAQAFLSVGHGRGKSQRARAENV